MLGEGLLSTKLREVLGSIPCGLCVYQFAGGKLTSVYQNQAFYEIMGYSEGCVRSVEEEAAFLGVHPEDIEPLREKVGTLIRENGRLTHTYRAWNERKQSYIVIHLDGSVKNSEDGTKILYCACQDISGQMELEQKLTETNVKLHDVINAIPGGVALYKVSDIFETRYFSDGVPQLSGYTVEEYRELMKRDAAELTYPGDTAMVAEKVREAVESRSVVEFEFRRFHRDGSLVWLHVQAKRVGEEDGCPLLQCVYHNVSALKETQLEMAHLVNSIPGGIASYRMEGERFLVTFFSDGVAALSGHHREELKKLAEEDVFDLIYPPDRDRVSREAKAAYRSGEVLDLSYRMRHKNGSLIWVHLNGRRMGPLSENARFYCVFTGMSAEARLFQSIANETADGIYVIDKNNYDLLYVNESKNLFAKGADILGQKCYKVLHGKSAPCEFCTLTNPESEGKEHRMDIDGTDRFYTTRFRETDWNGIPAFVKYVRDVTDEVCNRKEKERLELYFKNIVKNLPGGVMVIRCEPDGRILPEYISDGFAAMTHMTLEEAKELYGQDALAGIVQEDVEQVKEQLACYLKRGRGHCEVTSRLRRGGGRYVWVKGMFSLLKSEDGIRRLYSVYSDISKSVEEKAQLRRQYEDLIIQHYRTPGPDEMILGHCNITQNRILEIIDHTDSDLLKTFGSVREEFFTGIASLVVDEKERQAFLDKYLNAPALEAFKRNDTEQLLRCFIKLPQEAEGRYVQFKVNMVETPDTGDITGILTVTDITEQTISDRILHQLSAIGYDFVVDLNLRQDSYSLLACNKNANYLPKDHGSHSERTAEMLRTVIVQKDLEQYRRGLNPELMCRRLEKEGFYTFTFSIVDEEGEIWTKTMTVSAIDLRLGRVCLMRTDITKSVSEQQGLLNMMAYTFELMGFINVSSRQFTMYTRQTVLENLAPYVVEDYNAAIGGLENYYSMGEGKEESQEQFRLETLLKRLTEKPSGYDFVFPYHSEEGVRYKQINVLWGDQNHRTICMVRADVTDIMVAERQSKKALEKALMLAEEANQAKSDFLSAMSHDIRTPMNAVIGMTALAAAHLDERDRVDDCLKKISISSKHLLSLINDVLDMSKIERSKITLNIARTSVYGLLEQLSAMMEPQARDAGIILRIQTGAIRHETICADELRINQILINILSNAIKFTPEGGSVDVLAEEMASLKGDGWVRLCFTVSDTGIGMRPEFLAHIFEPFSRSRSAARIEGTGLGLSITKGLVELMGGQIFVESQVDRGTTFRIELECEAAEPAKDSTVKTDKESGSGAELGHVFDGRLFLVAEDNALNAEILSELLLMHGGKSVIKTDGTEVVKEFEDTALGTYDAILMDIQMPEMNGYEATRLIRKLERPDAAQIPIVAMTANAFSEDIQASRDAGMNGHVAKPIDMEVLRAVLGKALAETAIDKK